MSTHAKGLFILFYFIFIYLDFFFFFTAVGHHIMQFYLKFGSGVLIKPSLA